MILVRFCCKNKMVKFDNIDVIIWLYFVFDFVKILCIFEYKKYKKI